MEIKSALLVHLCPWGICFLDVPAHLNMLRYCGAVVQNRREGFGKSNLERMKSFWCFACWFWKPELSSPSSRHSPCHFGAEVVPQLLWSS